MPRDMGLGGDLQQDMEYRNHASDKTFADAVWGKVVGVLSGRALLFLKHQTGEIPGLKVSSVGVV